MPREIINAIDSTGSDDPPLMAQAFLSWGWKPEFGSCVATLDINHRVNGEWRGVGVALEWGDLERLNRMVRRAMKSYLKRATESELPVPEMPVDEREAAHHSR